MVLVIDCGSSKTPGIIKILNKHNVNAQLCGFRQLSDALIKKSKATIIGGSPTLLTECSLKYYLDPFRFLLHYEKPILGICFGHQIMGLLNGSNVYKGKEINRCEEITFVTKSPLTTGMENVLTFEEDHQEYIDVPENYYLMATSSSCAVEGMIHQEKPHYGVQFHPEISGKNGELLLMNFINMHR